MTASTEDQTDAAALGGGVVAVGMTMFADPGRYDLLSAIVCAALLLLIFGYLGNRARDFRKSVAVAAVVAIVALPILGVPADIWKLGLWSDFGEYRDWMRARAANPMAEEPSTVSDGATFVAWLLATALVTAADRFFYQRRLRTAAGKEAAAES